MSLRLKDTAVCNISGNSNSSGNGTIIVYPEIDNEINFGGTTSGDTSTIYIGHRIKDNRPIPTKYRFGNGTADVIAKTFIGALSGNASSASILQTARTLTIGNTGKSFNGSANISWSLSEIGAVPYVYSTTSSPLIESGAPFSSAKSYYETKAPTGSIMALYSQLGAEKTLIFSRGSEKYGSILNYGYSDKYIRIARHSNGNWSSTDWEKISAGYADSSGTATKLATARTISLTGSVTGSGSFDGSGNLSITTSTGRIIRTTNTTSNYVDFVTYYKGSSASSSGYDAQIGWHNTGNTTGAFIILPYNTTTSPWDSSVGLYIAKGVLKTDGKQVWHSGNFDATSLINRVTSLESQLNGVSTALTSLEAAVK